MNNDPEARLAALEAILNEQQEKTRDLEAELQALTKGIYSGSIGNQLLAFGLNSPFTGPPTPPPSAAAASNMNRTWWSDQQRNGMTR